MTGGFCLPLCWDREVHSYGIGNISCCPQTAWYPVRWLNWHLNCKAPSSAGSSFTTGWKCRLLELHVLALASLTGRASAGVVVTSCSSFPLESEQRKWDQITIEGVPVRQKKDLIVKEACGTLHLRGSLMRVSHLWFGFLPENRRWP